MTRQRGRRKGIPKGGSPVRAPRIGSKHYIIGDQRGRGGNGLVFVEYILNVNHHAKHFIGITLKSAESSYFVSCISACSVPCFHSVAI